MNRDREIVRIFEAYDLTSSYRAAAELAYCDHQTVARYANLTGVRAEPRGGVHRARPVEGLARQEPAPNSPTAWFTGPDLQNAGDHLRPPCLDTDNCLSSSIVRSGCP